MHLQLNSEGFEAERPRSTISFTTLASFCGAMPLMFCTAKQLTSQTGNTTVSNQLRNDYII